MCGINPRHPREPKDSYEVRRPFWAYMAKMSRPTYKLEENQRVEL
jgi:hypothetical protein